MTASDIVPFGGPGNGQPLTMSTLEIAELTGKRHDNVMRDAKAMLAELYGDGGILNFEDTHRNTQNGQSYPIYRLPKRESLILVSGYSVEMRARIIDRWMELEGAVASNVHFLVPKTLPEALRLAADLAEENAAQKARIEADRPKVEFHDGVAEAINCQTIEEVAKVLGTGQNRLFKWMRGAGILRANNLPFQRHVDEGYLRVVERQYKDKRGESHTYTRTLVTGKGLAYIQKRFTDEGEAA